MTRLEIRVELLASSTVAKNDTNASVKNRQMASRGDRSVSTEPDCAGRCGGYK